MSVFRVGQRVRLARHLFGPDIAKAAVGSEGRIVSELFTERFSGVLVHDVQLLPGSIFTGMYCSPDELEPINYDGNKVVSFDECLWKPEGEFV